MNTQQLRTHSYRLLGALVIAATALSGSAYAVRRDGLHGHQLPRRKSVIPR